MTLPLPNTVDMHRRWLTALAALALLLCAAPVARSAPPVPGDGPYRVQMVYRVGKSLGPFAITIRSSSPRELAMWFALELVRDPRGRWRQRTGTGFGPFVEGGGSLLPTAYGPRETASLPRCPDAPTCDVPFPTSYGGRYVVRPLATSRYYVISAYNDVRVELDSMQWRVKDVASAGIRRVFTDQAQATGARVWGTTVEHFTSASAPGGPYGSSVFAHVPCERTGQGSATLTGRGATTGDGIPPQRLRCGLTSRYDYEFAYTPYQTMWRLEGDVTGVGGGLTRLFVFDFPRP